MEGGYWGTSFTLPRPPTPRVPGKGVWPRGEDPVVQGGTGPSRPGSSHSAFTTHLPASAAPSLSSGAPRLAGSGWAGQLRGPELGQRGHGDPGEPEVRPRTEDATDAFSQPGRGPTPARSCWLSGDPLPGWNQRWAMESGGRALKWSSV